ncbi:ArdC family protein [Ursidibacter sp. B-7004-1]
MNTQQPKFDLYQHITDRILTALEQGTAPWLKPWNNPDCNMNLPRNAVSNRLYSGVNTLLLWISSAEHGYKQCKWITAKKANELGGHIRKGEKATIVMNYRPDEREKLDENGDVVYDEDGNPEMEQHIFIKKHNLFNLDQCENLPAELYDPVPVSKNAKSEPNQYDIFADIRQIIKGMDLHVEMKPSNSAYYQPSADLVVMPEMKQFANAQAFHSVLLHEMTHATGAAKRLNREGITSRKAKFGNPTYAFEELIAEIGGAFLCAYLGFDTVPQNAAYIESWIRVLKEDKRAIVRASGKAREACQYMLDALNIAQLADKYEIFEEAA